MCLEHKTKMRVYREMKWEVGFQEYFEHKQSSFWIIFQILFRYPLASDVQHSALLHPKFTLCPVVHQSELGM